MTPDIRSTQHDYTTSVLDDLDEISLAPNSVAISLKVRRAIPIHATRAEKANWLAGKGLCADQLACDARFGDLYWLCLRSIEYLDSHTQTFGLYFTRVNR